MKTLLSIAVVFGLLLVSTANAADVISLNFSENKNNQGFAGGEMIGPLKTDSANWNSTNDLDSGTLATGAMGSLVDDSGTDTGASVSWESKNTWYNSDGTADDEHKMAVGYLDDGLTTSPAGVQITFEDIPYDLYRVYGLLASDQNANSGLYDMRNFQVNGAWVLGGDATTTAPAYGNIEKSMTDTGSYWSLADGTTRGGYWTIDTSGSTLTINGLERVGGDPIRGSITAVIIEQIPEPSTLALLAALGLCGLGVYGWRRR